MNRIAISLAVVLLVGLPALVAHADQAVCDKILAANVKTGSNGGQMKMSGYDFAGDTPKLYGLGDHDCSYLRDETVDGQTGAVYREQYKGDTGSTTATIWISKIQRPLAARGARRRHHRQRQGAHFLSLEFDAVSASVRMLPRLHDRQLFQGK